MAPLAPPPDPLLWYAPTLNSYFILHRERFSDIYLVQTHSCEFLNVFLILLLGYMLEEILNLNCEIKWSPF